MSISNRLLSCVFLDICIRVQAMQPKTNLPPYNQRHQAQKWQRAMVCICESNNPVIITNKTMASDCTTERMLYRMCFAGADIWIKSSIFTENTAEFGVGFTCDTC
eukprot:110912_1